MFINRNAAHPSVPNAQDPSADPQIVPDPEMLKGGLDGAAFLVTDDFKGNQDPIDVPKVGNIKGPDELLGIGFGLSALELIDEIALLIVPD